MSSNINRLQTPLPEGARTVAKAIMLRRINEARKAIGRPRLAELTPECRPSSCSRCVLGVHFPEAHAVWPTEIEVSTDRGYDQAVRIVRAAGEAWGTEVNVRSPGCYSVSVELPPDLVMATRAFDAGQIPELIDPDLGHVDNEDLSAPVEACEILEDHPAFFVGATVRLVRAVDRYPHFIARVGATGIVSEANAEFVRVKMDDEIPGCEEWDNEIEWYVANGDNPAEDLEGISAEFHRSLTEKFEVES